jgi:putative holliday junction resolvase
MKLLAIDFGRKRLGFALGNPSISTAAPLDPFTYKNTKQALAHIKDLVDQYDVTRILLGYPLNMDGTASETSRQVEHFKSHLSKALGAGIAIEYVDERLSSFEAEEELKPLHPHFKKRNRFIDSMSALVILRRFMENK